MLIVDSITKDIDPWVAAFKKELGDQNVITWEEMENPSLVDVAVVWNHRPELFSHLPNLKLVASLGAGVDHIVSDSSLLPHIQVSKVVSTELSGPMSNFCIGAVMYFHRQFDKYLADKKNKNWHQQFDPEIEVRIGILGLGALGQDLAKKLVSLRFEVSGLSRTQKELESVTTYSELEMDTFLANTNLLICMLPATEETNGILNANLINKLPKGSYLINVGRGRQQVDEDIIACLDSGQLAGAFLDVFPQEPLPPSSPMWEHPQVFITPHIAVVTKLEAAIPQIVENYKRLKANEKLINLIDRTKGY